MKDYVHAYHFFYFFRSVLLVLRARMFKNNDLNTIRKILSYCYLGDWWVSTRARKMQFERIYLHIYPIDSFSKINNTSILWRCFINWVGIPTRISSDICSVILNMILRSRRKEPKEKKEEDIDDQLNISMETKVILTVLMKMMIWTFLWLAPKMEAPGILLLVEEGIIKLLWLTMPNYG